MLAGVDALRSLGDCRELLRPPSRQLRLLFRLRMWFAIWLGVPAPLQFGGGFPGCVCRATWRLSHVEELFAAGLQRCGARYRSLIQEPGQRGTGLLRSTCRGRGG